MEFLQTLADIFGAIVIFLKTFVTPISHWMRDWIDAVYSFVRDNFFGELMIFIIIGVVIIIAGVIVNIIWPGDIKGSIFSKGKIEEIVEKPSKEEEDIVDTVRRCKDCGNPIGDADVCPLCGARN